MEHLLGHAVQSQAPVTSPITCPICSKQFSRKEHLKRHHRSKHEATVDFHCASCDRSFTRRDIWQRHMKTHDPGAHKPKRRKNTLPPPADIFSLDSSLLLQNGQFDNQIDLAALTTIPNQAVLSDTEKQATLDLQTPLSVTLPQLSPSQDTASPSDAYTLIDYSIHPGALTPSYEILFGESDKPVWDQLLTKLEPLTAAQPAISNNTALRAVDHQDAPDASQPETQKTISSFAAQTPASAPDFSLLNDTYLTGNSSQNKVGPEAKQLGYGQFQQVLYGLCQTPHLKPMILPEEIASFPTVEQVNCFIDAFFDRFSQIYSFIHKPTFNVQTCPLGLLLAIAAHGARYTKNPKDYTAQSQALFGVARRCLHYAMYENFGVVREVWWQKACHLLNLAGLPAITSTQLEAAEIGDRIAVLTCQRQKWLSEPSAHPRGDHHLPLKQRWLSWVAQEERKRLALCIFAVESNASLIWGTSTSDLWNEVASSTLPCSSELWQAPDEQTWASLPSTPQPQFYELFRRACDPTAGLETHPGFQNHFTVMILLWFVHVFATKAKTTWSTTSYLFESKNSDSELVAGLSKHQMSQLKNCRGCFERVANTRVGTSAGTMLARHTALIGLTDHLPAVFLQTLAQQTTQSSTWPCPPIIKEWIESGNGRRARESAYYAAQTYRLFGAREGDTDSVNMSNVSNCFSLFYAALVLSLYCRFQAQHVQTSEEPDIVLNYLRLRSDPIIESWVQNDCGRVSLEGIGYLNSPDIRVRLVAASRILDVFGEALASNLNVSLCRQFGAVLLQLKAICDSDIEVLPSL